MTHRLCKFVSSPGKLSLLTLALLATPLAMAQTDTTGWYGGASVGQSKASIDEARITSGLLANGLIAGPISPVNRDLGYKIFGGYQFNRYWALEAGYFDLGTFGFSTTTAPAGSLAGDSRLKGLNLDAVGTLPITDKFAVFGRL
ncbi:MAG: outer membrane beta-barrel protein, partial [Rhodoferax sp.]|nr:outer membrane beta-barrel protein [Rhodoferax sp.]